MKFLKILVLIGVISYLFSFSPTIASAPLRQLKDYSPTEQLAYFAKQYGSDYAVMYSVINCESGWNVSIRPGDHGLANNVTQFHEDTFIRWSKEKGEALDYHSTTDHLKLMAWAFSQGEQYKTAWTTYVAIKQGGTYTFTHNEKLYVVHCKMKAT